MKHTILTFLKFGNYENILDLYNNGTVYINTIQYFRKFEDEELRGDKYEGASWVKNSLPGNFYIESINHTVNYQKIHIREAYEEVLGNIYSLYCVSSYGILNPFEFEMDKRIIKFGTHCLMIKDNDYFLKQIRKCLEREGYEFSDGFVEYYNKEKVTKQLTLFDKPSEFEYQKEFRFSIENNTIKPIILNIGSLKQYAQIYETRDIVNLKLVANAK